MRSSDCYRVTVVGSVSQAALELIEARFGCTATVHGARSDTTLALTGDQPALRALLTLLWDLGHEIAVLDHDGPPKTEFPHGTSA